MTRFIVPFALLVACQSGDPPPQLGNVYGEANEMPPPSDAGVKGRIAPEEIRRVVRSHVAEIKACYDRALVSAPALEGRVAVAFVIDRTGGVASASPAASTTMSNVAVVDCVIKTFTSMKFPAPEGGVVSVVYPFDFRPGG